MKNFKQISKLVHKSTKLALPGVLWRRKWTKVQGFGQNVQFPKRLESMGRIIRTTTDLIPMIQRVCRS